MVARIEPSEMEDVVNEILKKYNQWDKLPVDIEHLIDVQMGIDIVPTPGLRSNFSIDAVTSYMIRGGPSVMVPVSNTIDSNRNQSVVDMLNAFTKQIGGIPVSKDGKPIGQPNVVTRKHQIRRRN